MPKVSKNNARKPLIEGTFTFSASNSRTGLVSGDPQWSSFSVSVRAPSEDGSRWDSVRVDFSRDDAERLHAFLSRTLSESVK